MKLLNESNNEDNNTLNNGMMDLIGEYDVIYQHIQTLSSALRDEQVKTALTCLQYEHGQKAIKTFEKELNISSIEIADNRLRAVFWDRALSLSGVRQFMSQVRRDEWAALVTSYQDTSGKRIPAFTKQNIIATLTNLLSMRGDYLGERTVGLYKALSGNHVTNIPQAFNTRMILSEVYMGFGSLQQRGYIHDLRSIVAMISRHEQPSMQGTNMLVDAAFKSEHVGEWLFIDKGTFRMKAYMRGTVHLQISPAIAWELNKIIALYMGRALPPESKKAFKGTGTWESYDYSEKTVSEGARLALAELQRIDPAAIISHGQKVNRTREYLYRIGGYGYSDNVVSEVEAVLVELGAIPCQVVQQTGAGGESSLVDAYSACEEITTKVNDVVFVGLLKYEKAP